MRTQSIACVYFSPTGTTRTIVEAIARGVGAGTAEMLDITQRAQRGRRRMVFDDDLVVLAAPVYYGRVPEEITSHLAALEAHNTPAALVVVYGNRAFEDALLELHDIAAAGGFVPVAGGAFVAEHSYSTADYPIAHGRPDPGDLRQAEAFGAAVREKIAGLTSLAGLPPLALPGEAPYIEPVSLRMIQKARSAVALTPEPDPSNCTRCGQCAEVCPTGAISSEDVARTDRWQCIICFACVKSCPQAARHMHEPNFQQAIRLLQQKCQERKEPEFYL